MQAIQPKMQNKNAFVSQLHTRQQEYVLVCPRTHSGHLDDLRTQEPVVADEVPQRASGIRARLLLVVRQQLDEWPHRRSQSVVQGRVVEAGVADREARELPAKARTRTK
jgi:hypothetical protein